MLIHTEEKEGFTIRYYAEEEDLSPVGAFASGDEELDKQTLADIESGKLLWFCAKVTASKANVELAADYIGACCYESYAEFMTGDGYYADMVSAVIVEAKEKVKELCHV